MTTNSSFQLFSPFDDKPNSRLGFLEASDPPLLPHPPSIEVLSSEVFSSEVLISAVPCFSQGWKSTFDGQLFDVHFTRSFYKHILGAKVTYHDIEAIDPNYFKNRKWMLENDISDVLDLTYSIDADKEKLILYERTQVPLEGFSALQGISGSQMFQIHKAYGSPDHLSSDHTCFNQLDLLESV